MGIEWIPNGYENTNGTGTEGLLNGNDREMEQIQNGNR